MKVLMMTGVVANNTNGSVRYQNCWKALAPSSRAASYISLLALERMPVARNMTDGTPTHAQQKNPKSRSDHLESYEMMVKFSLTQPQSFKSPTMGPLSQNMK